MRKCKVIFHMKSGDKIAVKVKTELKNSFEVAKYYIDILNNNRDCIACFEHLAATNKKGYLINLCTVESFEILWIGMHKEEYKTSELVSEEELYRPVVHPPVYHQIKEKMKVVKG